MYEIWLMLNILWEIALGVWPLLLLTAVLWLALMGAASRAAGAHWRAGLPPALIMGVIAAMAAFLLVPGALRSTLSDMGYWLDWATLSGLAAAVGGLWQPSPGQCLPGGAGAPGFESIQGASIPCLTDTTQPTACTFESFQTRPVAR